MKHYVLLGLNPSIRENSKIAFHIPINNSQDSNKINEINKLINDKILNVLSFSEYYVESSENTWENLIAENPYFSSIEKPIEKIEDFINTLNNVTVNSIDVAMFVLRKEKKCDALKLQKLCYLIYAKYLKEYNVSLFKESFYAWKHGPVNKEIYYFFDKDSKNKIIYHKSELEIEKYNSKELIIESDELDDYYKRIILFSSKNNLADFISKVVDEYKDTKGVDLVNMLHQENTAWSKTKQNEIIKDEVIKDSIY